MKRPLVIDLFFGLGGWTRGFLEEGWDAVGFDIERHVYGEKRYPAQLVLQDVRTLHGSQFRYVDAIVASPPCQEYSYMAMPWKRAKEIAAALRGQGEFPEGYTGSRTREQLTALFDACFRIQREANEAIRNHCVRCGFHLLSHHRWCGCECSTFEGGTRHIPLVVENVKGAQPWVGRAKANFGSYYLWGDVANVGGRVVAARPKFGESLRAARRLKYNPDGTAHGIGSWFAVADSKERGARAIKGPGGDWFADGRQGQDACASALKVPSESGRRTDVGNGVRFTSRDCGMEAEGVKQRGSGPEWFDNGICKSSSRSDFRKAASAMIAEIPFDLAQHIARVFKP